MEIFYTVGFVLGLIGVITGLIKMFFDWRKNRRFSLSVGLLLGGLLLIALSWYVFQDVFSAEYRW